MTLQDDIDLMCGAFENEANLAWEPEHVKAFARIAAIAGQGQALIDGMAWRKLEDAPGGELPKGVFLGRRQLDGEWLENGPFGRDSVSSAPEGIYQGDRAMRISVRADTPADLQTEIVKWLRNEAGNDEADMGRFAKTKTAKAGYRASVYRLREAADFIERLTIESKETSNV